MEDPGAIGGAIVVGLLAGVFSGLLGIGGGALFVPALVFFLGQSQLEGQATSLVGVVLVGLVGAWRQRAYGNLRLADALTIGALCPLGAVAGTVAANALPERGLEVLFALIQLYFAYGLARRALAPAARPGGASAG